VTNGGVIFIIRSTFLSPKEAERCSWNKPSPKTALGRNIVEEATRKISMKIQEALRTRLYFKNN
jgi:hypothetical protein